MKQHSSEQPTRRRARDPPAMQVRTIELRLRERRATYVRAGSEEFGRRGLHNGYRGDRVRQSFRRSTREAAAGLWTRVLGARGGRMKFVAKATTTGWLRRGGADAASRVPCSSSACAKHRYISETPFQKRRFKRQNAVSSFTSSSARSPPRPIRSDRGSANSRAHRPPHHDLLLNPHDFDGLVGQNYQRMVQTRRIRPNLVVASVRTIFSDAGRRGCHFLGRGKARVY